MSETTTLSIGSSGPIAHTRSSIGSMTLKNANYDDNRGSLGGVPSSQRPPRASPSRIDTISGPQGSSTKLSAMGRMEKRGVGSVTSSTTSNSESSSSFAMRQSHAKEGIRLAEMGDWDILVRRLPREPQLAHQKDHHGMLPIHWACTEDDAGPAVIHALLVAFPEGVLTRNNAQYLPIHIAVRAGLPNDSLKLLCDARPSSLLEETPSGKTPLMLAMESSLPADTINLLRKAQHAYEDPSEDNDNDRTIEDAKRDIEVQSHLLRESIMYAANPMTMMRNNSGQSSSLSIGRIQSNSSLGRFPSEARSSVSWADRRGQSSFAENNNNNDSAAAPPPPPQRSYLQLPPSNASVASTNTNNTTGAAQPPSAVVRYMDTLMRGAHSLPNDDSEMMSRYTTVEEQQMPRSTMANTMANASMSARANPLRATEGDLSHASNSGVCGVCYKKFSMFRKKYQCKSCWMVVCKKHVASKIELTGHKKKRSVCADCLVLHSEDGHPMLPAVPGTHNINNNNSAFPHTHTGTHNLNSSSIVPTAAATRFTRSGSTPGVQKTLGAMRNSVLSSTSDSMRHTMTSMPSRGSVRFASNASSVTSQGNTNSIVANEPVSFQPFQKPPPPQLPPSESMPLRGALDRYGSDTTASLTETDRNSAEVTVLHQRIGTLEDQNKMLLSRLADQEKQYDDCMLLLTQTMTRVAEIEIRVPGLRFGANGSERESDSDLNPASFEYNFPLTTSYSFGGK